MGEVATREIAHKYKPYGMKNNKKVAHIGGSVAKDARRSLENKLGDCVISNKNNKLLK